MSCVCHLNHWDLSKDRAKCCIVTELIYLPCSRRACACYRTPGLPAGGAGMCRVGVDAGGNLQSVQKPTPVARKGAGVSRKGEMCSFNQTCISLSLSCVSEYYCTEGLLLYKRGPSPLTFSVQTFRGVFKTSVTTLTNPKWYFIVVQLIH